MPTRKKYKKGGLIRKPRRFEDFIRKIKPSYQSKREMEESLLLMYERTLGMPLKSNIPKFEVRELYSKVGVSGDNVVIEEPLPYTKDFVTEQLIKKIIPFIKVEHLIDDTANHIVVASIKIAQDKEEKENVK